MAKKRTPKARTNPETNIALSESDIAVIDALGILFNIAIGGRDAAGQQVAGAFDSRIQHWTRASMPKTAATMGLMKKLADDLDRPRTAGFGGLGGRRHGPAGELHP